MLSNFITQVTPEMSDASIKVSTEEAQVQARAATRTAQSIQEELGRRGLRS